MAILGAAFWVVVQSVGIARAQTVVAGDRVNFSSPVLDSDQIVILGNGPRPIDANAKAAHWLDVEGRASVEQAHEVAQAGRFIRGNLPKPIVLKGNETLWIKLHIERQAWQPRLYLETQNPGLDLIELYAMRPDGRWSKARAGDSLPADAWTDHARKPIFALPEHDENLQGPYQTLYLRITHAIVPVTVPLGLQDSESLYKAQRVHYFLLGGYFGLTCIVLLWALARGLLRRDKVYRSYAVLTGAMIVLQISTIGLGAQWVWPAWPLVTQVLAFASVPLYAAAGIWFSVVFTQMHRLSLSLYRTALMMIGVGLLIGVVQIFWQGRVSFVLANLYAVLTMFATTIIFLYAHRRGTRYALAAWIGFLPVIVCGCLPLARNLGWLGTGFWTQYAIAIGAAFEVVILFFVLISRESELRDARVRVAALSSVDPLTGCSDKRVFLTRLHECLLRSVQFKQRCALLRIEVRNFEWFEKEHGNAKAEAALVVAASAVQGVARDVDTLGRLGKAEFGLLLDGPVDSGTAMRAATQALARSLAPSDALPVGSQLNLVFAVCMLPDSNHATETLSAAEIWSWLTEIHGTAELGPRNRVLAVNL